MVNIMIADDDQNHNITFKNFLSKEKDINVVATTTTGRETINTYLAKKPDLLFLDLQMPDLTGLDVIENLSKVSNQKDIVILSGSDSYKLKLSNLSKVYWMISKPFLAQNVLDVIHAYTQERFSDSLYQRVVDILFKLKFNLSSIGTKYFIDLIIIKFNSEKHFELKELYSIIAKKRNEKSYIQIKWSIENSLSSAKRFQDEEILYSILDGYNKYIPFNITYLSDLIVFQLKKEVK